MKSLYAECMELMYPLAACLVVAARSLTSEMGSLEIHYVLRKAHSLTAMHSVCSYSHRIHTFPITSATAAATAHLEEKHFGVAAEPPVRLRERRNLGSCEIFSKVPSMVIYN